MEGVTKSLAARDDFVLFLFTLMTNKKTFLQTATLIEDILGVKKVRILFLVGLFSVFSTLEGAPDQRTHCH